MSQGVKRCLVIVPTIRQPEVVVEYAENARAHGFDLDRLTFMLVTEDWVDTSDAVVRLRQLGVECLSYDQSGRENWFREHNAASYIDLIPRKSHAETSFGLLPLWSSRDWEYGFFIDDDTRPHGLDDFFGRHIQNLEYEGEIPEASADGPWVNVLFESFASHGLFPRGFPYGQRGQTGARGSVTLARGEVALSQGLWTDVPDLDSVQILSQGSLTGIPSTRLERRDFSSTFSVAPGKYLTVCSMNLAFRREVIPAFYQLPMDDNPWHIGRFDDIWSGVIVKRAIDWIGKRILSGFPLCHHEKSPRNTFKDLLAEVPALEPNETFYQLVDSCELMGCSYFEVSSAIADTLAKDESTPFIRYVGNYLHRWVDLIRNLS
jgi:hypothetical protein